MAKGPATESASKLVEQVLGDVGHHLKRARLEQQRSVRDVTRAARLGHGTLSRVENPDLRDAHQSGVGLAVVCRVADALGLDVEIRFTTREVPDP